MKNKVVIIGGGYSVKEGIENGLWKILKQKRDSVAVWAINSSFKFMPIVPDVLLWLDESFYKQALPDIKKLKCRKYYTFHPKWQQLEDGIAYKVTRHFSGKLISRDNRIYVTKNGLTGGFAISLAITEGFEDIYLCGYDFGLVTTKLDKDNCYYTHWYQDEIKTIKWLSAGVGKPSVYHIQDNKQVKELHMRSFKYYNQFHNRICNVSPKSNLDAFPKINYKKFFELL